MAPTSKLGTSTYYFGHFPPKLIEIEKNGQTGCLRNRKVNIKLKSVNDLELNSTVQKCLT